LPKRQALYLVLNTKRLRAFSNLAREKRSPSQQKDRQAPPRYRKKRPRFSEGKGRRSRLSTSPSQKMEESTRSRRNGGALPNLQTKKVGPPLNLSNQKKENFSTSCFKTRRKLPHPPQVIRGKRRQLLSRRELHNILVSRFSVLRRVKRPHSYS